jgi:LmbE family N-acetylglucosaminyl deacetylase
MREMNRALTIVLAPHPDDEVIGAGWLLTRCTNAVVLHATDGAPRDRRLWSQRAPRHRAQYAKLRRTEALNALRLAGLSAERVRCLPFVDQELALDLVALTRAVRDTCLQLSAAGIIAPPYEGGHPDHDACAFAAQAAARLVERSCGRRPFICEMTSYHRRDGALCTQRFLPNATCEYVHMLEPDEHARKRSMLACFESQREVLAAFHADEERFRLAPEYDFGAPPHAPPLHYEQLGWRLRADDFCRFASRALVQLGLEGGRSCA